MAETDLEWDERQLCSDDACIGIIGAGNVCTVCGRPGPEGSPYRERPVSVSRDAMDDDAAQAQVAADGEAADFDDERELCADDACIGLIGPDGRCKECGKPRAGATAPT